MVYRMGNTSIVRNSGQPLPDPCTSDCDLFCWFPPNKRERERERVHGSNWWCHEHVCMLQTCMCAAFTCRCTCMYTNMYAHICTPHISKYSIRASVRAAIYYHVTYVYHIMYIMHIPVLLANARYHMYMHVRL